VDRPPFGSEGICGSTYLCFRDWRSTGIPKSRINIDDFRIDYEAFSDTLPDEAFPKGADW
jgi:hypothetical protein